VWYSDSVMIALVLTVFMLSATDELFAIFCCVIEVAEVIVGYVSVIDCL